MIECITKVEIDGDNSQVMPNPDLSAARKCTIWLVGWY